jgi:2OG-Fe(II) oxygenase superfamily
MSTPDTAVPDKDAPQKDVPHKETHVKDFIAITPNALAPEICAEIIGHIRASDALRPGQVGGGVFPELKHSRDITITGNPEWQQVEQTLNMAMLGGLIRYLREYPQALIAPLMLQQPGPDGALRRLSADDLAAKDDAGIIELIRACLRPGSINLQWYRAGEGGYPYWHCELYPRDNTAETLHRHLLWTLYLNDDFEEGETEFMFQQRKVKPETGVLLIAPTSFTHTHRGNRPQRGDKFIATSWILFQRADVMYGGG